MGYELQRLQTKHQALIDLSIQGFDSKEIASQMGMSEPGVQGILNSVLAQDEIARRRRALEKVNDGVVGSSVSKAREVLEEHAATAAEGLVHLMKNGSDDRVKLSATTNLLDRVGLGDKKMDAASTTPQIIITAGLAKRLTIVLDEDRDDLNEKNIEARKIQSSVLVGTPTGIGEESKVVGLSSPGDSTSGLLQPNGLPSSEVAKASAA